MTVLKTAGIMVIASAGNEGSSCATISSSPAHHSEVTFSVGANDYRNDRIVSFSSRGPSTFDGQIGPDVTAPGVRIKFAVRGGDTLVGDGVEPRWLGPTLSVRSH